MNNKNLKDIIMKYEPITSNFNRLFLLGQNMLRAGQDPTDSDAVANVGDLASMNALNWIREKMLNSREGNYIIKNRLRFRSEFVGLEDLKSYGKNTLGFHYYQFMSSHGYETNDRPIVRYFTDVELAYVLLRYREIHDFFHVLLGYDTDVTSELAVKVFESMHLRLPSASISGLFGTIRVIQDVNNFITLTKDYVPHVCANAESCEFLMNVIYEEELKTDITELRRRLNIIPLNEFI